MSQSSESTDRQAPAGRAVPSGTKDLASAGGPREPKVGLLEGMATMRTIRRYSDEPIPQEDLCSILWHATRAPSGTNRQPFRFLVLRHGPGAVRVRRLLGEAFRGGWAKKCDEEGWIVDASARGGGARERMLRAMQIYVDNFERTPVIVLALFKRYRELHHMEGASIFPACQNLLLAARALGYGGCFSGWHHLVEDDLRQILAIPDDVEISLTITLGKPQGKHGPVRRRPLDQLVFEDSWGGSAPWARDPAGTRFTGGGPPER